MSAELVDPFAPQRVKISDMREDINSRLLYCQYDDPTLFPQLIAKTLHELSAAAEGSDPGQDGLPVEVWARALLEQLHHRAVTGVAYNDEPADSLDPDPRHIPGSERG